MAEVTVEQLVEFTRELGELGAGQARVEAALQEASRRMETTDKVVSGHAAALQDGVRAEIRQLDKKLQEYMTGGHLESCPFLQHQKERFARETEVKQGKERRRWNVRDAITIGAAMAVLGTVLGLGQWGLQRRLEKLIEVATPAPTVPADRPEPPVLRIVP